MKVKTFPRGTHPHHYKEATSGKIIENMPAGPVTMPSLFVRAATQRATEEELKARYPGMSVTTVDAAHFIQMEKPQEFNRILEQFLLEVGD